MRPLPDLSPLLPFVDFYDPAADDFTRLLADQSPSYSDLLGLLGPTADQLLGDTGLLTSTVDDIGLIFTQIDQTFGQINAGIENVDYTATIATVIAQENIFYSGLDGVNTNAQPPVDNILNYILGLLAKLVQWILAQLAALVAWVVAQIQNLAIQIGFAGGGGGGGAGGGGFGGQGNPFPFLEPIPGGGGS